MILKSSNVRRGKLSRITQRFGPQVTQEIIDCLLSVLRGEIATDRERNRSRQKADAEREEERNEVGHKKGSGSTLRYAPLYKITFCVVPLAYSRASITLTVRLLRLVTVNNRCSSASESVRSTIGMTCVVQQTSVATWRSRFDWR